MKVILEYDPDDHEDRGASLRVLKANSVYNALWNVLDHVERIDNPVLLSRLNEIVIECGIDLENEWG